MLEYPPFITDLDSGQQVPNPLYEAYQEGIKQKQIEQSLQDDEYALAWAEGDREFCLEIDRVKHPNFFVRLFWRIVYKWQHR